MIILMERNNPIVLILIKAIVDDGQRKEKEKKVE